MHGFEPAGGWNLLILTIFQLPATRRPDAHATPHATYSHTTSLLAWLGLYGCCDLAARTQTHTQTHAHT
jgi:hypothetical protein